MKTLKLFLVFLLFINFAKAQILLTTSDECSLKQSKDNNSSLLAIIPSNRNIELIDYTEDGYFEVIFEGKTGFVHNIFVKYCDNYYKAIQVKNNQLTNVYNNNKSTIDKTNNYKINEEKLWYKDLDIAYFQSIQKKSSETTNEKRPQLLPVLKISDIKFIDKSGNNIIDGNEQCIIEFIISNNGKGSATNITATSKDKTNTKGLIIKKTTDIGTIAPSESKKVEIPVSGTIDLVSNTANILISFEEKYGFQPSPIEISIETREILKPNVKIVDHSFHTNDGVISLGLPVQLKVLVQNVGQGIAENVIVNFILPKENVFPNGPQNLTVGTMHSGSSKELVFEFIANRIFTGKTIPITVQVSEKYNRFSENSNLIANIDAKSSISVINIASITDDYSDKKDIQIASLTSGVDRDIPTTPIKNPNRLALIIGNENYSSRQRGLSSEVDVAFAVNDAKIFKEYCEKTLGIEEKNIFLIINATSAEMNQKIELVSQLLDRLENDGELIFFYAGHGHPDEKSREPYLIPVDVSGSNLTSAIKLYDVYKKFSQTGAKKITVFLDACFTGGGRESGLLAARAVRVRPREETISGNMVVFSATSEDQSALPYHNEKHGMFTYFLLKKLQETNGDVNLGSLEEYLRRNVSIESLRINHKPQDPKTSVSVQVQDLWESWKLK